MHSVEFIQIPCLSDNYAVLLHDAETHETALIDAPEAEPVARVLRDRGWRLGTIFVTHHHRDHVAGVMDLKSEFGCDVVGPALEADRIPGLSTAVSEQSQYSFAGLPVQVVATPGHTLGHVTYYWPALKTAFTGDTLFVMGCGRIFESDAKTMWSSLKKIAALPEDTNIYCGHEYTLANARFALSVDPGNTELRARFDDLAAGDAANLVSTPTTIDLERRTNPFLRAADPAIRASLGMTAALDWEVFKCLRDLKNRA